LRPVKLAALWRPGCKRLMKGGQLLPWSSVTTSQQETRSCLITEQLRCGAASSYENACGKSSPETTLAS
jgi:hypothetical protein